MKQDLASIKFDQDATNSPNITGGSPLKACNHLRSAIVTGTDNASVIAAFKRRITKVNEHDLCGVRIIPVSSALPFFFL